MTRAITKYCELCIIFMTLWENSNFDYSLDMHYWSIVNNNYRKILFHQNCDIVPLDKVSYIESWIWKKNENSLRRYKTLISWLSLQWCFDVLTLFGVTVDLIVWCYELNIHYMHDVRKDFINPFFVLYGPEVVSNVTT